jgi:uracil-DNA glycosylase family 4
MNWKEDTYITNILGCRPFTIERRRDKNNKVNRPPTRIERDACWPRLFETIYRVDPLLIITMGKIAANTLLVNTSTLPSLQGRVHTCIIQGRYTEVRYPVLCMYPISHLTRSAGAKRSNEGPWQETYENFYEVTEILDHLRHAYWGIPRPDRGDD